MWKNIRILAPNDTGRTVIVVTNCSANCVEISRPQQWGPDLPFFWASRPCGPPGWLALLLIKAGDVETNPGPTTTQKQVWICDAISAINKYTVGSRYP